MLRQVTLAPGIVERVVPAAAYGHSTLVDVSAFRVDELARSHQIVCMTQEDSAASESAVARLLSREEAEREDRLYWHSKTPAERLAAAERLRQVAYGYDAATTRIQAIVVRTCLKGS